MDEKNILKRKAEENDCLDDPLIASNYSPDDPLIVTAPRKKLKPSKPARQPTTDVVEVLEDEEKLLHEEEKQLIPTSANAIARRYQVEILQVAIQKNTIVYLETGCGKTLIAVLLIKEIGHKLKAEGEKGLIIFLAPTVQLVMQQCEVIRINTDLKVADYYGAKGVDGWNIEIWNTEISSNEVLVMTPQILLDALRHSFLKLEMVKLLVFDECHHTQRHHPYAKIMNEYYHTTQAKPKIFGMTASPVIRKGVSSSDDCEDQIARLEDILDSKVYALDDRKELELFVPTPNQITKFYGMPNCPHEALKQKLVSLREKYEASEAYQSHTLHSEFKDNEDFYKTLRKQIRSIHGNVMYCLEKMGLFCAFKAAQIYMERDKTETLLEPDVEAIDIIQTTKDGFLKEAFQILEDALPSGMDKFCSTLKDVSVAVKQGLLTPKILALVQVLLSYREVKDLRCIIFVERVIATAVISCLIKQLDCLSHISSGYLAGGASVLDVMGRKKQQNTLDLLRIGKVNVLVTTNVAEEGIDVQGCSCIIRFDLPRTVRSYIQSRGRARRPQSHYVVLLERGNERQRDTMFDVVQSEKSMRDMSMNRTHIPVAPKSSIEEGTISYRVLSTEATVNCDSSISFIYRYCAKLPGDKYYMPRPEFVFKSVAGEENLHNCILKLPPNAPFQEVISPPSAKLFHAKQLACLEACKRLHEIGALDDHLLPVAEAGSEEEEVMNFKGEKTTGAGTTKRKELHPTCKAKALSGSWVEDLNGVTLQIYKMVFTPQDNDEGAYADFALLIETVLDDDIASTEIELHLTAGRVVKSIFIPCGKLQLNSVQLKDAKVFQEVLCNGIFGKLIRRPKKSNVSKAVMMDSGGAKIMESKWVTSNMYLLLPLELHEGGVSPTEVNIDWKCISNCADVARSFKSGSWSNDDPCRRDGTDLLLTGVGDSRSICLASGFQSVSDLIDKAIVTIHTGKIYCVTGVIHDKTAESPFPDSEDPDATHYSSYNDYFQKKYGKTIIFLKQPLLQIKQSHRPHNLLTQQVEKSKGKECNLKLDGPNYIELPPELCLNLGVSSSVIRSLYLVPSVMHRMTTLMLGCQLRDEIKDHPSCPSIPASLIMQALTTTRCLENFSFERLELLGDSVLKYAVSCHLFLKYDKKHEGQLSARRSWAICNATLHGLAARRNLPGYVRDEPFDPRRWVAPGMLCSKVVACCCNTRNFEESVKVVSENEYRVVKIGKTCDKGHRWMCSKTVADSVEALIGAYLVGGGLTAAFKFMSWMNIEVALEPALVEGAFKHASVHAHVLRNTNLHALESQLGYTFHNKALLVEAITHASQQDSEGGCCYQRLEFLGDSVLDFLITRHLFSAHTDLSPGVLTDLRSAAVNNENFAQVAVKHNLQQYLRHGSGALLGQITAFIKAVQQCKENKSHCTSFGGGIKGPKVLGDLIESIAGAILVDSRFDLEQVWEIMKPILSPIVTPETLDLHPLREVCELCHLNGYSIIWNKSTQQGKLTVVTVEVKLEDCTIYGKGCKLNKKTAKKEAAQQILTQMEERGIWHPRRQSMYRREASDAGVGRTTELRVEECISPKGITDRCKREEESCQGEKVTRKKARIVDTSGNLITSQDPSRREPKASQSQEVTRKEARLIETPLNCNTSEEPYSDMKENNEGRVAIDICNQNWSPQDASSEVLTRSSILEEESNNVGGMCNSKVESEAVSTEKIIVAKKSSVELSSGGVCISISMLKGGPRARLHDLCKKLKWAEPDYQLVERDNLPHTMRFVIRAVLDIPERGQVTIQGDARRDKKSAKDSAALLTLFELEKQGLCVIEQ
uniref:Dicer-like 3 n=1 Tax=Ginkgo biloba TaxID=3311 RepID=A0A0C4W3E2_GINBI|nr:Dicer-like 3 [Ginkgo biloba]